MPQLINKHTFGATAGAGCALVYFDEQLLLVFPGGGGLGNAAPNFKINLMPVGNPASPNDSYSNDLLIVRSETTAERPAAAVHNGILYIAYADMSPVRQVRMLAFTSLAEPPKQIEFSDTAIGGPALISYNGFLILSFAGGGGLGGASPDTHLNILWSDVGWNPTLSTPGKVSGKVVLNHTSRHSPALASVLDGGQYPQLALAFTGTNNQLYLLNAGGMNFGEMNFGPGDTMQVIGHSSDYGPALATFNEANLPSGRPSSGEGDWWITLLWGGNGDKQLNSMVGQGEPRVSGQASYTDTSAFEPAVIRNPSLQSGNQYFCAWAGTDPVHRLNIALVPRLP